MPIHIGKPLDWAAPAAPGDGEALFELLGQELRRMSAGEQLEVVSALQGGGWGALRAELQERFDGLAHAYLEGED